LRAKLDAKYGLSLKLWETQNNIIEYDGKWVLPFFGTAETCASQTMQAFTKHSKTTRLLFLYLFLTTVFFKCCPKTISACCLSTKNWQKSRRSIDLWVQI
jgi:hypothetical protein